MGRRTKKLNSSWPIVNSHITDDSLFFSVCRTCFFVVSCLVSCMNKVHVYSSSVFCWFVNFCFVFYVFFFPLLNMFKHCWFCYMAFCVCCFFFYIFLSDRSTNHFQRHIKINRFRFEIRNAYSYFLIMTIKRRTHIKM